MKCKQCEVEGEKSVVHVGPAFTTLMAGQEFYDEEGRWHNHDPNITTQSYRCSQGHSWSEDRRSKCRACSSDSDTGDTKP